MDNVSSQPIFKILIASSVWTHQICKQILFVHFSLGHSNNWTHSLPQKIKIKYNNTNIYKMYRISIVSIGNMVSKEQACDLFFTFRQSNFSCLNVNLNNELQYLNIYGDRTPKWHESCCTESRYKHFVGELDKRIDYLHPIELLTLVTNWCECQRRHDYIYQFSTKLIYLPFFFLLKVTRSHFCA